MFSYDADPNSRWSIQNIVLELAEKIQKGNIEEYKKYEEEFNKQFSDKVIQRTVKGIRDNIFDNILAWSTNETIAEHLDIDKLWLEKVKDRAFIFDNFYDQPEYTMTYVDWDHNFKW